MIDPVLGVDQATGLELRLMPRRTRQGLAWYLYLTRAGRLVRSVKRLYICCNRHFRYEARRDKTRNIEAEARYCIELAFPVYGTVTRVMQLLSIEDLMEKACSMASMCIPGCFPGAVEWTEGRGLYTSVDCPRYCRYRRPYWPMDRELQGFRECAKWYMADVDCSFEEAWLCSEPRPAILASGEPERFCRWTP